MSVQAADILLKYSTKSGAAGNANAGSASGSLGKYISTTEVPTGVKNNLFADVSGDENLGSEARFRCIFVHNANATDTFLNAKVFVQSEVAGGAETYLGVDPTAASAIGSASAQALEIADGNTAPVGVTFDNPTIEQDALPLGDIGPGECKAVWVMRQALNSAALEGDGATIRVQGESV